MSLSVEVKVEHFIVISEQVVLEKYFNTNSKNPRFKCMIRFYFFIFYDSSIINSSLSFQHPFHSPVFGTQPKKSILKKTHSFTLKGFSPLVSPAETPYTTVTGAESRLDQ